jgi:mono/diheme cytochrome c family protein
MVKKVLMGLGGLIGLAALGIVGKFYIASPASRAAEDLTAPTDEATVAHGKYLANHVYACMACHSELSEELPGEPLIEGRLGSGRVFPPDPYAPGTIRSANLTPHHLKDWTDGEIVRAIREGVGNEGRGLFPMMPYMLYSKVMPKDEALAIVAYLRTLEPVDNNPGITEIAFPVSMFVRAVPAPVETEPAAAPAPDDPGRGAYLLKAAVCAECHTTMDDKRQPVPGMDYAGGTMIPHGSQILNTPNITPHETGIAAYTDEELHNAIFEGKGRDGRDLFVMPWTFYGGMTPGDRKALIAELRKVAPVEHNVERLAAGTH